MGGLQPWHWLIVLFFLAMIAAIVVAIVLALTRSKRKTVGQGAPGGPAPGWYPDPKDPTAMRYFDGQNWVTQAGPPH